MKTSVAEALEARALFALVTFTVDPALSSLRLSGKVADVFDIESQHSGSLTDTYEGSIVADVQDSLISFPGGSNVVAQATRKYDPGSDLANYGAKGETGGVFSVKLGEAAVRSFAFDLSSANDLGVGDSGAFAASGLRVDTTSGKLDYDLRVGGDGSVDLDGEHVDNSGAGNATLRGSDGNRTLTIPVDFSFDAGSTELRLRGTLVATAGSGAPIDPNVVRIGDGTLNRSVQFVDADGTTGTITLTGGGSADVRFTNASQQTPAKAGAVVVVGTGVQLLGVDAVATTPRTKLAITGKGGTDRVVNVASVTTDGAAGAVGGKGAVFTGDVTIAGPLTTLSGAGLSNATVTADSIANVKIAGDVANSTVTLDAPLSDATLAVRTFSVTGSVSGSRLSAAGRLGNVKAKTMTGSEIYSAIADTAARFPVTSDLAAGSAIGNVSTKTFADSIVAADSLGKLSLGTIVTDNAGTPFGVTAGAFAGLTATNSSKQKLKLIATSDPAALAAQPFDTGDYTIRLA